MFFLNLSQKSKKDTEVPLFIRSPATSFGTHCESELIEAREQMEHRVNKRAFLPDVEPKFHNSPFYPKQTWKKFEVSVTIITRRRISAYLHRYIF